MPGKKQKKKKREQAEAATEAPAPAAEEHERDRIGTDEDSSAEAAARSPAAERAEPESAPGHDAAAATDPTADDTTDTPRAHVAAPAEAEAKSFASAAAADTEDHAAAGAAPSLTAAEQLKIAKELSNCIYQCCNDFLTRSDTRIPDDFKCKPRAKGLIMFYDYMHQTNLNSHVAFILAALYIAGRGLSNDIHSAIASLDRAVSSKAHRIILQLRDSRNRMTYASQAVAVFTQSYKPQNIHYHPADIFSQLQTFLGLMLGNEAHFSYDENFIRALEEGLFNNISFSQMFTSQQPLGALTYRHLSLLDTNKIVTELASHPFFVDSASATSKSAHEESYLATAAAYVGEKLGLG